MDETRRAENLVDRMSRWMSDRSPLISRREHERQLAELRHATDDLMQGIQSLGEATKHASQAWSASARVWQASASRFKRERDEAREEVERLRATVATLVLGATTRQPDGPV
jgi:hypothetical protein